MTTQELLKQAIEICSEYMDVVSINFEIKFDLEEKSEWLQLTVFYKIKNTKSNFHVVTYSNQKEYGIKTLLRLVKFKAQETHKEYYPDEKITDLEIKLNPKN